MAEEWKFRRRQGSCSACGRTFAAGETLFSVLQFAAAELQRGDLCDRCFDGHGATAELFFWRTVFPAARRRIQIDFEQLLQILQALKDDLRPERLDFCFLLALLAVRHRKLRLLAVRRRGAGEVLVLRRPRARQEFEVEVRELSEARRAELTGVLGELLDPTQEGAAQDLLEAWRGLPQEKEKASPAGPVENS